jgi:4-carboxymuconolactone decarboxylase
MPRIGPLSKEEQDDQTRELLAAYVTADFVPNVLATMVRHPGLYRRWLPFLGKLLAGKLPARDRELVTLRTCWNCKTEYEWGQHARTAFDAGIGTADLARIIAGPDAPGWDDHDVTLLRAADELHVNSTISDGTWSALAAEYDDQQLIEVCMVIGQYHLTAFALNSLDVDLDEGLQGFPND